MIPYDYPTHVDSHSIHYVWHVLSFYATCLQATSIKKPFCTSQNWLKGTLCKRFRNFVGKTMVSCAFTPQTKPLQFQELWFGDAKDVIITWKINIFKCRLHLNTCSVYIP